MSRARFPSSDIVRLLAEQRERWVLWLPLGMIAGAAAWLSAPRDPPIGAGAGLFVLGAVAALLAAFWPSARRDGALAWLRTVVAGAAAMASAFGLGAAGAELRTYAVHAPPFAAQETPVWIEGWVSAVESGPRLRLRVRAIEGEGPTPRFVRIAIPARGALTVGRAARCLAVLRAPAAPLAPGAYDFARRAYFERLAATGFSYGRCRPAAFAAPADPLARMGLAVGAFRSDLSASIRAHAPGRGGAVAAALITGDVSGIDERVNLALRDSGLGHLLSVSGMHMGVVGGLVFSTLLGVFSLIAPIALRFPVKKIAATGALAALFAYLVVSGASVPALRSFIMAAVAFGAILLDRPAISMRGLALATVIAVLVFPQSVLEPGFQMSFAATMALVALFEASKRAREETILPTPGPVIGAMQWTSRLVGGVISISVAAGLATDAFALYHFQRLSIYALPANLIAAPIMSFIVAPAAGAAALAAPFGLAEGPLAVMASALDLIVAVGDTFGSRPEAVRALSQPPALALGLWVLAMAWACLWRGQVKWGAAPIAAGALALYAATPAPIGAFDQDLRAVYVRDGEAKAWRLIAQERRSDFARERLGTMLGISPVAQQTLAPPDACSAHACTWRTPGGRDVLLALDGQGLSECAHHDFVIAAQPLTADQRLVCPSVMIVDAAARARHGGALVYERRAGIRIAWSYPPTTRRPWMSAAPGE